MGDPSLALDGSVLTRSQTNTTQTNTTADSWWRIDLGFVYLFSDLFIIWRNILEGELFKFTVVKIGAKLFTCFIGQVLFLRRLKILQNVPLVLYVL